MRWEKTLRRLFSPCFEKTRPVCPATRSAKRRKRGSVIGDSVGGYATGFRIPQELERQHIVKRSATSGSSSRTLKVTFERVQRGIHGFDHDGMRIGLLDK